MWGELIRGITLGFSSGVAPGPFHSYLLGQALRNGWKRTLPAALAPVFSDGIIIAVVVLVLSRTPDGFLRGLKVVGGLFILYLASSAWRRFRATTDDWNPTADTGSQSLLEATTMNILNPNPWIFWSTIGGPLLLDAWRASSGRAIAFLGGFYVTIVGVFAAFIVLYATARRMGPRVARVFSGVAALALAVFGGFQLWSGLRG